MVLDLNRGEIQHTFASRLAMNGVDVGTLMKLLGHKTIATTLRYSHLSDKQRKDAVEMLMGNDLWLA